ncbi:MAG: hypothetical protein ACKVQW_15120 [Pyrinomonadaceae bacterium]
MKSAFFTIALAIMIVSVASAQSLTGRSGDKNKDIFTTMFAPGVSMTGIQNNAGTYDQNNDRCWGNTFVLRGRGEWFATHLTISMDYVEGLPNPKSGNQIILGTWSMAVFKDDEYYATYYGDMTEGNIGWWINPKTGFIEKRNTAATLRVTGTVDGPMMLRDEMPLIHFNADTRLDGNVAFTTAVMDIDF